jgi:hypothetical protein
MQSSESSEPDHDRDILRHADAVFLKEAGEVKRSKEAPYTLPYLCILANKR